MPLQPGQCRCCGGRAAARPVKPRKESREEEEEEELASVPAGAAPAAVPVGFFSRRPVQEAHTGVVVPWWHRQGGGGSAATLADAPALGMTGVAWGGTKWAGAEERAFADAWDAMVELLRELAADSKEKVLPMLSVRALPPPPPPPPPVPPSDMPTPRLLGA